mgnify:CR=1 FL=1
MDTIFISDLHLDKTRSDTIDYFLKFIKDRSATLEKLYILGDFVESWVGDDDPGHGVIDAFEILKSISKKTKIYFMHGNRDFMISSKICDKFGMELIEDPTLINLYDRKILLMHGDTLCVDDIKYQEFRQLVRDKSWQAQMMPLTEFNAPSHRHHKKAFHFFNDLNGRASYRFVGSRWCRASQAPSLCREDTSKLRS